MARVMGVAVSMLVTGLEELLVRVLPSAASELELCGELVGSRQAAGDAPTSTDH